MRSLFIIFLALLATLSLTSLPDVKAPPCSLALRGINGLRPLCGGGGSGCTSPCPWSLNPDDSDEAPAWTLDAGFLNQPCSRSNANSNGFLGAFPCVDFSPWQVDYYITGSDSTSLQSLNYYTSFLGTSGVFLCNSVDTAGLAGCHADYKSATYSWGCWGCTWPAQDKLNVPLRWLGNFTVKFDIGNFGNNGSPYFADTYLDY